MDNSTKHTTEPVAELVALLKEAADLGLTFEIGTAYIRRAYIDHQTDLRARISAAIAKAEAA